MAGVAALVAGAGCVRAGAGAGVAAVAVAGAGVSLEVAEAGAGSTAGAVAGAMADGVVTAAGASTTGGTTGARLIHQMPAATTAKAATAPPAIRGVRLAFWGARCGVVLCGAETAESSSATAGKAVAARG